MIIHLQKLTCVLPTIVAIVVLAFGVPSPAQAQESLDNSDIRISIAVAELTEIRKELKYLRARDVERQAWEEAFTKGLPVNGELSKDLQDLVTPLADAPANDGPRVSTLKPESNVSFFGAFVGDMLFNESRPISPGQPHYLSPASPTGQSQNTVDIHARSSYLAAAFSGPRLGDFQSGALALVFFYNDNVLIYVASAATAMGQIIVILLYAGRSPLQRLFIMPKLPS